MISGILLAAGGASRFGANKLLQELDGQPVIARALAVFDDPRIDERIVVVPPGRDEIRRALRERDDVRYVVNPDPARGIGSSIACGVDAVHATAAALLLALADEPTASALTTGAVLDAFEQQGAQIVGPRFGEDTPGHPVLFSRAVFAELRALDGDQGARSVLAREPARVAYIRMRGEAPSDVDTPADLARLRVRAQNTGAPNHHSS